ncbi:MAG: quinone-dependent dihydroorotate dehydrogenase [Candidatus Binataceae bacterium]
MATPPEFLYPRVIRPLLFRLDAERAHQVTLAFLALLPTIPRRRDPFELAVRLFGINFRNPVGVAAGLDKDARAIRAWSGLGFGFAEIGTITPRPQPGNVRPRIWRLPEHRALINRLGFPSAGMRTVARRVSRARHESLRIRIGLNFGPNKATAAQNVANDYSVLIRQLGRFADFIVINVSSPNTPGLREWQTPERLSELLGGIMDARDSLSRRPSILLKLAPDLDETMAARICDTALTSGISGIVAGNTTIAREEAGVKSELQGGLSGPPLLQKSRALIRDIYLSSGGKLPIIGVGGISSAQDAYAHIRAGASLVEIYTALIYEGPALVGAIKHGLVGLLARDGLRSISEAVGGDYQ